MSKKRPVGLATFIGRYNHQHRNSRIRLATPAQRHRGENKEVLASRHVLYQQARNQHPYRWSGSTRYWQPIGLSRSTRKVS